MTQDKANEIFNTPLGEQLDMFLTTSDDKIFIRYQEAIDHTNGVLEKNTQPLLDKTITEWYNEY